MRIRDAQLKALEAHALLRFEKELEEHVYRFSPVESAAMGDEKVAAFVHLGVKRALAHGFSLQGPIRFYLELMLIFGSNFDTDPLLPTITRALNEGVPGESELDRANRIYRAMDAYLWLVTGDNLVFAREALMRTLDWGLDYFPPPNLDFTRGVADHLRRIAPQRFEAAGIEGIHRLIESGCRTLHPLGPTHGADQALAIVLMFGLGHGCFSDLRYEWIATAVNPSLGLASFDLLRARARAYADAALTLMGGRNES
jgi:hypothetical protein